MKEVAVTLLFDRHTLRYVVPYEEPMDNPCCDDSLIADLRDISYVTGVERNIVTRSIVIRAKAPSEGDRGADLGSITSRFHKHGHRIREV